MPTNSHEIPTSAQSAAANVNHEEPGSPDVLAKLKQQASQLDFGSNWQIIQAYLTLGIGVLATKMKKDDSLRFHGCQAGIAALLVFAGHGVFTMLGGAFQNYLRTFWDFSAFGAWAYLIWRAAQGQSVSIPGLAAIARKQAGIR
jgi:hypothetical protein